MKGRNSNEIDFKKDVMSGTGVDNDCRMYSGSIGTSKNLYKNGDE